MKLGIGIDVLRDPTKVVEVWNNLSKRPFGRQLFSRALGLMAPYTGTVSPQVIELEPGHARVQIRDRWGVRNHLKSVHAVALMNLGEACTGLAAMSLVPAGGRGIVLELAMEYVKKARGTLTSECAIEPPAASERREVDVEAVIRDASGEVVARVRARWRIDLPARAERPAEAAAATDAA